MERVSMPYLLFFPRYETKCVIKFYLNSEDVIILKNYLNS